MPEFRDEARTSVRTLKSWRGLDAIVWIVGRYIAQTQTVFTWVGNRRWARRTNFLTLAQTDQ